MASQIPAHPSGTISRADARGIDGDITLGTAITNVTIKTYGLEGPVRKTVFTFTASALAITDALAYSSALLATFPRGKIAVLSAVDYLAFTTTSTLASTLNASAVVSHGFGSAPASNIVLSGTMMNILPGVAVVGATAVAVSNFTASATINVAGAAITASLLGASTPIDGSSTAVPIYFNLGVPTNTEIDGDATLTVTGTFVIVWTNLGGYDFANV